MKPSKFSTRLVLFLYGMPNMIGCVLALVVMSLFFAGVIAKWWFPMTLAAYAMGWLATPKSDVFEIEFLNDNQGELLVEVLDDLASRAGPKLPADAVRYLASIRARVHELLPRLQAPDSGMTPMTSIDLTHAVGRDLPETIQNYLALPAGFAQLHTVRDGKTAKQLLVEQMALLDKQVESVSNAVFERDAERLAVHGQYLQEKFSPVNFLES